MREKVVELNFGDWVLRSRDGKVLRFICKDNIASHFGRFVSKDNELHRAEYKEVEPAPGCDSFDWEPFVIEVGKFYELADGSTAKATEKHRTTDAFLIGGFWYDQGCRVPPGYGSESIYSIVREVPAPVDLRKKFEEEWEKRHWCPVLENGSLRPITLVTGDTICTSITNNKFSDRLSWSITWPDGSKIFTE